MASFRVFADGTANLPISMREGISVLPCEYEVDGYSQIYDGNLEYFDEHVFYEGLRKGKRIRTSLLNAHLFISHFEKILANGIDIIYISMSSGISGTYNAAMLAARELMDKYKERFIHVVDSLGCGFGSGLLAVKAAGLNREGMSAREAAVCLDKEVLHTCQYFTVDDLNFLRNTGRIGEMTAKIGSVLNIKPILFGDKTGHIISCAKVRGRRKAIEMLAEKYEEKHIRTEKQNICISHGDCINDANSLADLLRSISPENTITICPHEPFSGSHVGPGMLGLFFRGIER